MPFCGARGCCFLGDSVIIYWLDVRDSRGFGHFTADEKVFYYYSYR